MINLLTKGTGAVGRLLFGRTLILDGAGAPTSGASGTAAGKAGPGSRYTDRTNGAVYINVNTKASPTWAAYAGVADGVVRFAEISVSSAELLALRATPKSLVAAPGAGKMVEFVSVVAIADNGVAYVVGTNDLAIRYKDGTGDIVSQTIDTAGLIDQVTDIVTQAGPIATDTKTPKAEAENQPLVLHNIGGSELTTGTGVLRLKVAYRSWTTGW